MESEKMKNIKLNIDGKEVLANEGMTVLQAARQAGIFIPTLCYNEKLASYGGCRLCLVELNRNNRKRLVASCVYQAEEGLVIATETEQIRKNTDLRNRVLLLSRQIAFYVVYASVIALR
jgi:bidirectional [NiFe] hydrogenase diaphorase subunit